MERDDLVRLRRAKDQMDREYASPLDVPALARTAEMSPGHFSRSFRTAYGETPYSYLMTRRIERAMTLLRRGDLSVAKGLLRGLNFSSPISTQPSSECRPPAQR